MNLERFALAAALWLPAAAVLCAPPAARADSDARAAAYGPAPARAYTPAPPSRPVGFLLRLGLDFGGDKVASATYTDGSSVDVKGGGLVTIAGGLLFHPADPYAVEATFGYKVDNATAKNGEIKFQRFPVDLIASYVAAGRHRIGAGPTLHLAPKATCSVTSICADTVRFSNALGFVAQYAYGMPSGDRGLELGARYTAITYRPTAAGAKALDGSSFGVFVGGWL